MENVHPLIERLYGLDRRGLAVLRRSLAYEPGTFPAAYPYVESYVRHESERTPYYLLAGLYALYERAESERGSTPTGTRRSTLGSAAADLYERKEKSPSIESRFIALLDADEEQLPNRLRQMVSLLRSESISIDWQRLLDDLRWWSFPERTVQQRWARDFYRAVPATLETEPNESDTETE